MDRDQRQRQRRLRSSSVVRDTMNQDQSRNQRHQRSSSVVPDMHPRLTQRRTFTPFPPLPALLPAPSTPSQRRSWKEPPPAPSLRVLSYADNIISLTWNMNRMTPYHAKIKQYQLFFDFDRTNAPTERPWIKIGDMESCPLPMICNITRFVPRGEYHFIIRAVDEHDRPGNFSRPASFYTD